MTTIAIYERRFPNGMSKHAVSVFVTLMRKLTPPTCIVLGLNRWHHSDR